MEGNDTEIIGTNELAHRLGITRQRVDQLVKTEGMPKIGRGKFDFAACRDWYEGFKNIGRPDKSSFDERKRLVIAQAEKTELETAKLRGELIASEEVAQLLYELSVIFLSQHDSLGPRLANHLSGISNPGEIQVEIKKETDAIRDTVAGQLQAIADRLGSSADYKAAAAS
jgi:phage terminase Nu1 subunit (DNA packaging protein)